MKRDTPKAITDIVKDFEKQFEKTASDATSNNADENQPQRDAERSGADGAKNAADTAHDEVNLPSQKWKELEDLSEKIRDGMPKVEQAARFIWLKALAGIAVVGLAFSSLHTPNETLRNDQASRQALSEEISAQIHQIQVSEDQFNMIVGGLTVAAPPEPAPMPAAVAAVAAEPVQVEVTTPSGTQNYSSTIGRVYQNIPAARPFIQQSAPPPIEHDYDRPSPPPSSESSFQNHDQRYDRNFTVNSPIGSLSIGLGR